MRTLATLATTTLLLLFMATAPAYPQDDAKPENKAAQQDDKNKQDKDKEKDKAAKPDEAKPGQEQPAVRPDERKPEGRKNDDRKDDRKNDERQNQAPNENRQPAASQPQQQRPAQEMNRGHEQHQAQRGKRIPDDKFRASFGHQHTFHVQRTQVVNTSQPVVVFGGYSFELVDAWPVDWGFDDDVYVDYVDDGYYLFDVLHPGIRIAVFVVE